MVALKKWLGVKEVAYELGLSKTTVIGLTEKIDPVTGIPFLKSRRPAERKLDICSESLRKHQEAVNDPLFWQIRRDAQQKLDAGRGTHSGLGRTAEKAALRKASGLPATKVRR